MPKERIILNYTKVQCGTKEGYENILNDLCTIYWHAGMKREAWWKWSRIKLFDWHECFLRRCWKTFWCCSITFVVRNVQRFALFFVYFLLGWAWDVWCFTIFIKLCVMILFVGLTVDAPRSTFALIVIMMAATARTEDIHLGTSSLDDRKVDIFDILKQKCMV